MKLGRFSAASVRVIPGLLLALSAAPADAQAPGRSFNAGRTGVAPPVARYVAGDDENFVLDRSGRTPLLKFEDSAEVWVLRPAPGPRGDVIYKDDLGRPVIRASRLGGVTVFTSENPRGLPAALAGRAQAIRLTVIRPEALLGHFVQQSRRASRALRKRILFETGEDATPATSILFADAATIASEAVARFAARARGRGVASRLETVRVTTGRRPGAAVSGDTLEVTIAPQLGVAGRPSSERIIRALDAAG